MVKTHERNEPHIMSMIDSDPRRRKWSRPGILLAVLGLVLLSIGIGVFVVNQAEVQTRTRLVREALAARRLDEAKIRIEEWAAQKPRGGELEYYEARLQILLEHPAEAMDLLRKAIESGYPEREVLILRAVIQTRGGIFDQAEPILSVAWQDGSEPRAEIAEGLARIYLSTFRLAEASQAIDRWIEASPDDARPYMFRNDIDERMGVDAPVLVRNYRAALQRDPSLDTARIGLANLLLKTRQIDEADVEFSAYLERNPRSLEGLLGAGQVALLRGDLNAASGAFKGALEIDPNDAVALSELGLIDLRNGRFELASQRLKNAVDALPFDAEVRYKYSRALKLAGNEALANEESAVAERLQGEQTRIDDLRKALVNRPDDADLRGEAAKWLIEHGHEKEGLEWTQLILKQKPGHGPTCRLLVDYHTRKGNMGLANYYRLAAANNPSDPMK